MSGSQHYGSYFHKSTADDFAFDSNDPVTICAWFYPESDFAISPNSCYPIWFTTTDGDDLNATRIYFHDPGGGNVLLFQSGQGLGGLYAYSQACAYDAWVHVALTFDGTSFRSYVNGVLVDTQALAPSGRAAYGIATIASQWTTCTVQDVYIFDQALSGAQVVTVKETLAPPSGVSPLAWWPLGDTDPTDDASGNGHDLDQGGTANGTTWVDPETGDALDGTGQVSVSGAAAVSSAVALTGTGQSRVSGAAAVSEGVAVTGTGQSRVSGAAAVSAATAVTGTGQSSVSASATITESTATALIGTGQNSVSGAAAVSEGVALVGTGQSSVSGAATITSAIALVGTGAASVSGVAALSEAVALLGTGQVSVSGAATLDGGGTVQLIGTGQVSVSGAATASTVAALTGTGQSSVSAGATAGVANALTGHGDVSVGGTALLSAGLSVDGTGQVSVAATAAIASAIAATGTGQVGCSASASLSMAIAMVGTGQVAVQATGTLTGFAPPAIGDGNDTEAGRRWLGASGSRGRARR